MTTAETAELAVNLKLGTTGSFAGATNQLKTIETAAAGAGGRISGAVSTGFSKASTAASKFGGALSHAKSQLGGLISGPLGLIGLGAGLFTVVGALEQGVTHAEDMALAVEKLTGVTGLSAQSASELVAVFGKFGIETSKAVIIAGFAEKTLGKLAASTDKLTKFDKAYGLNLVDNKGHVVDFATELGQVADFYNSNRSAADKATVAATLFGRGYTALIPVLKLGSKGIAEARAEADKLGLTLKSAEDVKNVHDFIAAQREAKDALGGLEVQLGLLVMPDLTGALKSFTGFLSTHREEVKTFFKGAIDVAKGLAGFITGTLIPAASSVAGVFATAWNAIPAPFRDLLVKGVIADRTIKFLFGVSPIKVVASLAEGALSKGLGAILGQFIGKGVVQPVFVTNQVLGGGLPGAAGAAEGAAGGLLPKIVSLIPAGLLAAGIIAAAVPIGQAFASALPDWLKGPGGQGKSQSQIAREAADAAVAASRATPLAPTLLDRGGRESGISGSLQGKLIDDKLAGSLAQLGAAITATFRSALDTLKHSTDPARLLNAVKTLREVMVANGHGSVAQTKETIAALTAQLKKTHDPTLQAALRGAITDLKNKIPGREYAAAEIAKADKIIKGTGTVADKIKGLQAIENDLKDHKLPGQTKALQARIDALKATTATAGRETSDAIRRKNLTAEVTVTTPTPIVNINARQVAHASWLVTRYFTGGHVMTK